MPTNQEWLHKLANESPDELKAWFDAEHVDDCVRNDGKMSEVGVRATDVDANDTKATCNKSGENVTYSREKLEADLRSLTVSWRDYDGNYMRTYSSVAYAQIKELLDRQAVITADENKELIEWQAATVARLQKEVDAIKAANDDYRDSYEASSRALKSICTHLAIEADGKPDILASLAIASIDALISERDNLASDLNEMLMSIDELRDRFRSASSAALDNAHEIQRIIDQFWNV